MFSARCAIADVDLVNAALAGAYGPANFSRPARSGTGDATHAVMHHLGNDPAFRAALAAIPQVTVSDTAFTAFAAAAGLDWTPQTEWFGSPIMIGAQRVHAGKTWESLVDYNVWTPPVNWREVVVSGYPAWVQPTGAGDAYALGARVSYFGVNYESLIPANVWAPDVYPAGWTVVP